MEIPRSSIPGRPSRAVPWKADAAPLAESFENPLYATIGNAARPSGRLTGSKRSFDRSPSNNPLFDGRASGQQPRSSGSVIRFASEHDDGGRLVAEIAAFRPGMYTVKFT